MRDAEQTNRNYKVQRNNCSSFLQNVDWPKRKKEMLSVYQGMAIELEEIIQCKQNSAVYIAVHRLPPAPAQSRAKHWLLLTNAANAATCHWIPFCRFVLVFFLFSHIYIYIYFVPFMCAGVSVIFSHQLHQNAKKYFCLYVWIYKVLLIWFNVYKIVAISVEQYLINKGELLLHPPVHVLMFLFPFCLPL